MAVKGFSKEEEQDLMSEIEGLIKQRGLNMELVDKRQNPNVRACPTCIVCTCMICV